MVGCRIGAALFVRRTSYHCCCSSCCNSCRGECMHLLYSARDDKTHLSTRVLMVPPIVQKQPMALPFDFLVSLLLSLLDVTTRSSHVRDCHAPNCHLCPRKLPRCHSSELCRSPRGTCTACSREGTTCSFFPAGSARPTTKSESMNTAHGMPVLYSKRFFERSTLNLQYYILHGCRWYCGRGWESAYMCHNCR